MTPYEQELLEKYLAHLNIVGHEGDYPDFEAWYQTVRYAPRDPGRRERWRKPANCATRTPGRRPGLQPDGRPAAEYESKRWKFNNQGD